MKPLCLLIFFSSLIGCKPQTETGKLLQTSKKIIKAIQNNRPKDFRALIAREDLNHIGKDDGMIAADIKKYNTLFQQYFNGREPLIEITDRYNFWGQKCVKIPIYEGKKDSSVTELHLSLLFGPSVFFPMDKITGYMLVQNNKDSIDFKPYSYWKERGIAK